MINRRNVVKKPKNNVSACEDFFLLVAEGHILTAAMKVFKMDNTEATPQVSQYFPKGCVNLDEGQKDKALLAACAHIVSQFVDLETLDGNSKPGDGNRDHVVEYAKEVLTMGLLLMNFNDSIHEGDGLRILMCWRFLLLIFKATGRKNYAIEALTLLCQYHDIFTPRLAEQLLWSRTVNVHGRHGKNIASDLHMEHLNRECKTCLLALGANITQKSVERVGRCLGDVVKITANFDEECGIPKESSHHSAHSVAKDMSMILAQLKDMEIFAYRKKREHSAFPGFLGNLIKKLNRVELDQWIQEQYKKMTTYDRT